MNADRKKQLAAQYKKKTVVGGIYAIDCSGNHRRYVKSTVDLDGLKNRFEFAMAIKTCPDPALNNEYLKYGSESFSFVVLEELEKEETQTDKEFSNDIKQLYALWLENSAESK